MIIAKDLTIHQIIALAEPDELREFAELLGTISDIPRQKRSRIFALACEAQEVLAGIKTESSDSMP